VPVLWLTIKPLESTFCSIKDHAAASVSDEAFDKREERWTEDTPDTKEAYFIREIFEGKFRPLCACLMGLRMNPTGFYPSRAAAKTAVRYEKLSRPPTFQLCSHPCSWIPRGDWGCAADPSGRAVKIHNAAYDGEEGDGDNVA
jgi:asparagine synthase (glutamine-hydrolysing)